MEEGERQKKTIQDNIDLLKLKKKVNSLQAEVDALEKEVGAMGGGEAQKQHSASASQIRDHQAKIERYNGRMSGLTEQKRSLKRKLNEP